MSGQYDVPAGQAESFGDALTEQVKNAPWFMISMAVHAVIAILLHFISAAPESPFVEPAVVSVDRTQEDEPEEPEEEPEEDQEEVETEDQVETEEPVVADTIDEPQTDDEALTEETLESDSDMTNDPFDSNSLANVVGLGASASGRWGQGRGGNKLRGGGGATKKTELTVKRALEWLSRHQSPDGSWDSDNFFQNGDPDLGALCDGKGRAPHDVGVSGLALLCFLGSGHTHREGDYKETVKKGLRWLKSVQDADGCFGPRGDSHYIYDHAIGALAMTEAFAMSRSVVWKAPAQKSIDFIQQAQNPYKAWRYGVRPGENDVSVTGWMVMALKAAKGAGLSMSDNAMNWSVAFIEEMTDEETGRTGYMKQGELPVRHPGAGERFPSNESEALTAVGVLSRIFGGQDPKEEEAIQKGAELMLRKLPVWEPESGRVDMYYWYYATLAMFQVGGSSWSKWNARMKEAIIDHQRRDGNFSGSWDPVGPWGEDGGRVYSTALMTLCMMVYYRYDRVFGGR